MSAADADVLVYYVHDDAGTVLATRHNGRKVAEHLRSLAAERDGLIEVNFSRCEVASVPFMDEVVRVARECGDQVIYSCLNEDVHRTLTFAENRANA